MAARGTADLNAAPKLPQANLKESAACRRNAALLAAAPRAWARPYVYQRLREGILSLDYVPGANLDEAQLVESFGLSRTPVREALIRLAADGLVVLLPDRGAQLAPVDLADFPRYVEAFDLVQRAVMRDAGPSSVCRNTPGGPICTTLRPGAFGRRRRRSSLEVSGTTARLALSRRAKISAVK